MPGARRRSGHCASGCPGWSHPDCRSRTPGRRYRRTSVCCAAPGPRKKTCCPARPGNRPPAGNGGCFSEDGRRTRRRRHPTRRTEPLPGNPPGPFRPGTIFYRGARRSGRNERGRTPPPGGRGRRRPSRKLPWILPRPRLLHRGKKPDEGPEPPSGDRRRRTTSGRADGRRSRPDHRARRGFRLRPRERTPGSRDSRSGFHAHRRFPA